MARQPTEKSTIIYYAQTIIYVFHTVGTVYAAESVAMKEMITATFRYQINQADMKFYIHFNRSKAYMKFRLDLYNMSAI
jgi:RNA polymerase-interacting CarD/CdnL/TRCF family regulator